MGLKTAGDQMMKKDPIDTEWLDYDVIVIGSGGAGAHAASAAAYSGATVLVVSKDPVGASDTKISEGLATVRASGAEDNDDTWVQTKRLREAACQSEG